MDVKTYRAPSMQAALALVRNELGPEAALLDSRELPRRGWRRWFGAGRIIEVTASCSVHVPSRLQNEFALGTAPAVRWADDDLDGIDLTTIVSPRRHASGGLSSRDVDAFIPSGQDEQNASLRAMLRDAPEPLFLLFAQLIDADVPEDEARKIVAAVHSERIWSESDGLFEARQAASQFLRSEFRVSGEIRLSPGERATVALVGPTGVGKTTTIAKLAANFRLREKRRVGLITVDTYRIAAVAQLRTYADIIDLPMEVVATPQEMRQAIARLADQELILLDTAGRSPNDEAQIQELRALLGEARPNAVHLVLSCTGGLATARKAIDSFASAGITDLILTKLDEVDGLGVLTPLLRSCGLPVSYLTDGQDVPDDIGAANADWLARAVLGIHDEQGERVVAG